MTAETVTVPLLQTDNKLAMRLASGDRLLVCYFPASDPRIPEAMIDVYGRCGVDIAEIGVKSDNPYLDGPVVRTSMERSSGKGVLADARAAVARLEDGQGSTAALVFAYGSRYFADSSAAQDWHGVDGLLCLPDLQAQADVRIKAGARDRGVRIAEFLPFAFTADDIERARNADAYVMLQASPGKTGARAELDASCEARLRRLRDEGVTARIVLGFGISDASHAKQAIEMGADGVVVGSQCVSKCLEGETVLEEFLCAIRAGLDD